MSDNNNDMAKQLLNMLSNMDKNQLNDGLSKVSKMLGANDKESLMNLINKQDKDKN